MRGFILVWVVILLVIGLAGGAYFLGRSNTPKPSSVPAVTSQTPQSTTAVSPESTSSAASPAPNGAGETANWKTYTNTKYGYSIKYPKDVSMKGTTDDPRSVLSVLFEKHGQQNTSLGTTVSYWAELSVIPVNNNQDLKTWATTDANQHLKNAFSKNQVSVFPYNENGLEGYTADGGIQWVVKYVWVKNNNYIFEFILGDGDPNGDYRDNKEAQKTFNKILSTFKFIP